MGPPPDDDHTCGWKTRATDLEAKLEETAAKLEEVAAKMAAMERRILGPKSEKLPPMDREVRTSNRPVGDCGKVLGDAAAVAAMLDRLLHHGHVLKCGPRSWRTKIGEGLPADSGNVAGEAPSR